MVATAYVVSYRNNTKYLLHFVHISKEIGCEDRLHNDLQCIKWNVNFYLTQFVKYVSHYKSII